MITTKQIDKTEAKISSLVEGLIENSNNSLINPHHLQKAIDESNPKLVRLACNNLVEQGVLLKRGSAYSPSPKYKF